MSYLWLRAVLLGPVNANMQCVGDKPQYQLTTLGIRLWPAASSFSQAHLAFFFFAFHNYFPLAISIIMPLEGEEVPFSWTITAKSETSATCLGSFLILVSFAAIKRHRGRSQSRVRQPHRFQQTQLRPPRKT